MSEERMGGELLALKMLLAHALAVSHLEREDARGDLAAIVNAVEQQIGESLAKMDLPAAKRSLEAIEGAARETTLYVGGLADSMLRHMGAPPASDG